MWSWVVVFWVVIVVWVNFEGSWGVGWLGGIGWFGDFFKVVVVGGGVGWYGVGCRGFFGGDGVGL